MNRSIVNELYPDSNIVLAQIQPTAGPCEIHAGQMWADTACCLGNHCKL